MDHRPVSRYRSLSTVTTDAAAPAPLTQIDGMDVVDEQVVVLSPVDVVRAQRRPGAARRTTPSRGDGHGLG